MRNTVRLLPAVLLVITGMSAPAIAALPQQSGAVDLLTQANVRVDGAAADDLAGRWVAGAGDLNGDGRDDVIVGAPAADDNGRNSSGSAYVVFGSASPVNVDLGSLGSAGFRIDGAVANDWAGMSVAGAGDLNGDGRDDVIVGAYTAGNNGRGNSGSAYVVYGFGAPTATYAPLTGTVGQPIASHAPSGVARTGAASFAVSPALPAGLSLDPGTGVVSGTPTLASGTTTHTVTMTDLAGSVAAPLQITIAALPAPPSPPTPDTRAPKLTVSVPKAPRAAARLRVRVRCDEACRVTVRAGTAKTVSWSLPAGRWVWVTMPVSRRTAAARVGGPVQVRLVATDTAGNRSQVMRTIRTVRPARR